MTASAVASLIRGLLRCRCGLSLVNLDQWEMPARSCAADMPLCLTRLRRWHEETHWHRDNASSHAWTHRLCILPGCSYQHHRSLYSNHSNRLGLPGL
ncbi:hypothetical protein NQZ68_028161 [Dissostichus eleginoides]|nr:hypothetical protein NQZ68_028161 [Dissostichus eleginoides]